MKSVLRRTRATCLRSARQGCLIIACAIASLSASAETVVTDYRFSTTEPEQSDIIELHPWQLGVFDPGSAAGATNPEIYYDGIDGTVGLVGSILGLLFDPPGLPLITSGGHFDAVSEIVTTGTIPFIGEVELARSLILSTDQETSMDYCSGGLSGLVCLGQSSITFQKNDVVIVEPNNQVIRVLLDGASVFDDHPDSNIDAVHYSLQGATPTIAFSVEDPATLYYTDIDPLATPVPTISEQTISLDGNDLVQCVLGSELSTPIAGARALLECTILLDGDTPLGNQLDGSSGNVTGLHVLEKLDTSGGIPGVPCGVNVDLGLLTALDLRPCPLLVTVDRPHADAHEKQIVAIESGIVAPYQAMADAMHLQVGRQQLYGIHVQEFVLDTAAGQVLFSSQRSDDIYQYGAAAGAEITVGDTILKQSGQDLFEGDVPPRHPHRMNIDAIDYDATGKLYYSTEESLVFDVNDKIKKKSDDNPALYVYDPDPAAQTSTELCPDLVGVAIDALHLQDGSNMWISVGAASDKVKLDGVAGGKVTVNMADLVLVNLGFGGCLVANGPAGGPADPVVDNYLKTPSASMNVDGLHILSDDEWVLSVDAPGTIGGVAVGPNDLVEWNPNTGTAEIILTGYDPDNGPLDTFVNSAVSRNVDAIWLKGVPETAGGNIDHYEITPGELGTDPVSGDPVGLGVTCAPADVTINAVDSAHAVVVDAGTVITLTADNGAPTPIGIWSLVDGEGLFANEGTTVPGCDAGTADDGIACYQFVPGADTAAGEDAGEVTFGLLHQLAGNVDISVTDGTASELSGTSIEITADPSFIYSTSGLQFAERKSGAPAYPADPALDSYIDIEIAGKPSNVAPYGEATNLDGGMYLRSIDSDVGGACLGLLNTEGIEMAFECDGLGACSGGESVMVDGVSLSEYPVFTAVTTTFDPATGIAPFVFNYPDAGRIRLHARVELGTSGDTVEGASNVFVVRPFTFDVPQASITSGPSATVANSPNPAGTAYAGGAFVSSGSAFSFRVDALSWQAADDTNLDGRADAGADLTDNAATPDFSAGVYPADVPVAVQTTTYTPSDGNPGGLWTLVDPSNPATARSLTTSIDAANFSAGTTLVSNQAYDEVGSIRLGVTADDYQCLAGDLLDCSDPAYDVAGASGDIGRFFADSIEIIAPLVSDGSCADPGGFTYMDHPVIGIDFTLQANNRFGEVTANYDDTLDAANSPHPDNPEQVYATAYTGTVGLVAEDAATGGALTGRITLKDSDPASLTWNQGLATYSRSDHAFARAASPDGPYDVQLGLDWTAGTDPVDLSPLDLFTASATALGDPLDVRFGRANVTGVYGPETASIEVPVQTEYFDGTAFVLNQDDNCTVLATGQFDLRGVDDDTNPDDSSDPLAGIMNVDVDDDSTTGSLANPTLDSGDAGFSFSAPGSGNTGSVFMTLDVTTQPWLLYDWDGDGNYNESPPEARITFGQRKGNDQVIFWQERIR